MKRMVSILLAAVMLLGFAVPAAATEGTLRLIVPEDWELQVGDSRTLDYTFSGNITERMLHWESDNENVATVDQWGRVTAVAQGSAVITATQITDGEPLTATAAVTVTEHPTGGTHATNIVNYQGTPVQEVKNLQKLVSRYAPDDASLPEAVRECIQAEDKTAYQSAVTADGAEWSITEYGVLRSDENAPTARDKEMRFMGDRYFHDTDTTNGKVLAIVPDGENGIWTVMAGGVTHIEMVEMSAADKAALMSDTTQQYVSRRGMVAEAYWDGSAWVPNETDNDGLWTAMYGAGELMRYAVLRDKLEQDPSNSELQRMTAEAKKTATSSTEAVLLLANISMRTGDTEAYVRYITDGGYDLYGTLPVYNNGGKGISDEALLKDGDYSLTTPDISPAKNWALGQNQPVDGSAWADPASSGGEFALRTRSLGGFIARTYSLHGEAGGNADSYRGTIYYDFSDYNESNPVAVGKSSSGGIVNNEDLKGIRVDASGTIPERLWNDLLGQDVSIQDIVYKGDTSTDEIIGHLFIYKLAYDVFRTEDPELAEIIADTVDRFAQHLADNEYMLVDASGQPTTWGKMNRQYFYTYRWGAPSSPLTASVLLTAFKLAAYTTGYEKWENEYRLLLQEGAYLYGDIMNTHSARDEEFLNKYAAPLLGDTLGGYSLTDALNAGGLPALAGMPGALPLTEEKNFLLRMFAQYSDEEMAALAFYTLFQMETDPDTLDIYRDALDQWWKESFQYSENPFLYYIYQLAYPDQTITDAYGNNILETAAWSLSRHPIDTRTWCASNNARDDIMVFDLEDYSEDLSTRGGLSIRKTELPPTAVGAEGIIAILLSGGITYGQYDLSALGVPLSGSLDVEYAVAAPDERALHKFNNSTYRLNDDNPNRMEGSTTYTLPYWMGVYHGMLELSEIGSPDGEVAVSFNDLTANGSDTQTTTELTLTFDQEVPGLSAEDLVLMGAEKGALTEVEGEPGKYTLAVSNLTVADKAVVTVTVRKDGYNFTPETREVPVRVYTPAAAPVITAPTSDTEVSGKDGETVTMTVSATNATSYQWFINRGKGWEQLPGETNPSYTTAPVKEENDGYRYYCRVANDQGSVDSPVFTLRFAGKGQVPTDPSGTDTPKTGDQFLWWPVALFFTSGLAIFVLYLLRRRSAAGKES